MKQSRSADEVFMARAVRLARSGTGATYPNPCVGAVVVRGGKVLAGARTRPTGGPHAEVVALTRAGRRARGTTLYVTLEPCSHHGHTPPCTDAIIDASVARVVVGIADPARHAKRQGLRRLRAAGIEVEVGVLRSVCEQVHEHYLHHVASGRPFVTLKAAMSLDGRIACPSGHSRWITGERARRHAHGLRARHHAVAVGAATVLEDDPRLSVRLVRGVDPVVVVFDTRLSIVRATPRIARPGALVFHTARASTRSRRALARTGAEPIELPADEHGGVAIVAALRELGRRNIRSLLVEGGGRLHGAFVRAKTWDQMFLYQAPRLLGDARPLIAGVSWARVDRAPSVHIESHRRLGADWLIVARPA